MSHSILDEQVLVLNKAWQAINVRSVEKVMKILMTGRAVALSPSDTEPGMFDPLPWPEWLELTLKPTDKVIRTAKRKIKVPDTIAVINYNKLPKRPQRLSHAAIKSRDGCVCQYTGKYCPNGNVDHVLPKDRGGQDTWENLVWCDQPVNEFKGNRLPEECGLKLIRKPKTPLPKVTSISINVPDNKPNWKWFIEKCR